MGELQDAVAALPHAELATPLARLFNETPETLAAGLRLAVPAMLAAMATRSQHGAIAEVMQHVGAAFTHGAPLARMRTAAHDPAVRHDLLADGAAFAQALLGPQHMPLAAGLALATGMPGETARTLLQLAGPLAAGALAGDASVPPPADRVVALLAAEQTALLAMLPPGISSLIGPLAAEATPLHGTVAEAAGAGAAGTSRWLPWLLAAAAGIALVAGLRSCSDMQAARKAGEPATTPMVTEVPVTTVPITLPDGSQAVLREGSSALELARLLASDRPLPRAIRLEDFEFAAEGVADPATVEAVRALAAVFLAAPAVRARIEGHSDSSGDPAAQLAASAERAATVRAALEQAGVAPSRLISEGIGSAQPIATNDTAEGRAQNNRIMLVVTAK